MDQNFDPREASGETAYRGARGLELNEVSLNGDADTTTLPGGALKRKGGYFRKKILIGKPKDQKPEEINLGESITVVFLKIRRRLIERGRDGEILRSTTEHNTKENAVTLYDAKTQTKMSGVAADLREKYEGLRTVQIVYALLVTPKSEPELVKLIIKGASLGSEAKAENVMNFYQYLGSFSGDEHVYEHKTVLGSVLEQGKKTYFAIDFKRGDKLSEKSLAFAMEKLKEVQAKCLEVDTARAQRIAKTVSSDITPEPAEEVEAGIEYPKDDINPDDIPF